MTRKKMTRRIKGPRLFEWQYDIVKGLKLHPRNCIHTVKSRRQCGKTTCIILILLQTAINNPDSVSILLSPTFPQAKKCYKELKKACSGNIVFLKSNDSDLEIYYKNGSSILFKSAAQRESLRGYTVKHGGILCIDESAYIPDDIFASVSQWVNVFKANILIVSTPRFQQGFFYDCYMKGLANERNFYSYDFCQYDTSVLLSPERIELYKKLLPRNQFMTEVEGKFLASDSLVFGDFSSVLSNNIMNTKEFCFGIDWGSGKGGDYTAVSIMNNALQQVEIKYFNDKDETSTINYIVELVKKYNSYGEVKKIVVEVNSIGQIFYGLLKKALYKNGIQSQLIPFNTSNTSKNNLVNQLIVAIQNNNIQLLDDEQLKLQFNMYECKISKSGKQTYNAHLGYHDDIIIATMLSYNAWKSANYNIL